MNQPKDQTTKPEVNHHPECQCEDCGNYKGSKTKVKHTLPLTVEPSGMDIHYSSHAFAILKNGKMIAHTYNAAFAKEIVCSVNSHDVLLEAAKVALEILNLHELRRYSNGEKLDIAKILEKAIAEAEEVK